MIPPSWVCLSFFACPGQRQTGGNGAVSESTFKAELDSCHGELFRGVRITVAPLIGPACCAGPCGREFAWGMVVHGLGEEAAQPLGLVGS